MVEMRLCKFTKKNFEISDREAAFCKRLGIPLPEIAPSERIRELMAFRNEWKLYRRKCDATGKEIISAYAPDAKFPVYENSVWWGDSWDARDFGRDFDFNRPFFEQFAELQKVVPREGTSIFNCENCDYNSHLRQSRNCYLNALGIKSEDCLYTYWTVENKDVADSMFINYSTLCYEGRHLNYCYNCVMLEESNNCTDCYFSYQLRGCDHCLFCSNLANKSYYLFNKPCTKEEFLKRGLRWREEDAPFRRINEGSRLCRRHDAEASLLRLGLEDRKEYQMATLAEIPDRLSDIKNDITKEMLACSSCSKNYRIILQELKLYRNLHLPIPRFCPECRNRNRIAEDNLRQVFSRQCSNCQKTIESPYRAEQPETVYCEKCYLETIR